MHTIVLPFQYLHLSMCPLPRLEQPYLVKSNQWSIINAAFRLVELPLGYRLLILANRFHVAVRLFSNRSQMTSTCGKSNKVAHELPASVSLMFLPHFDVLCDLFLNRRTTTWNLFVLYNDQKRKKTETHTCLEPLDCSRICASLGIF